MNPNPRRAGKRSASRLSRNRDFQRRLAQAIFLSKFRVQSMGLWHYAEGGIRFAFPPYAGYILHPIQEERLEDFWRQNREKSIERIVRRDPIG